MGDALAIALVAIFLGGGCLCWIGIIGYHIYKMVRGEL